MIKTINISLEDRQQIKKVLSKFSRKKADVEIFYDICFCICAPQTTYISNVRVINELITMDFYNKDMDISLLRDIVRAVRFVRKADYLMAVKEQFPDIMSILRSNYKNFVKREQLVNLIKGIGMKTASHFLRNQGVFDLAIIDTHIIKFLGCDLPQKKSDYIAIENKFIGIAEQLNITVSELDAYIWKVSSNTEWEDFKY
jgi:N-glycosylase/DNA lyase